MDRRVNLKGNKKKYIGMNENKETRYPSQRTQLNAERDFNSIKIYSIKVEKSHLKNLSFLVKNLENSEIEEISNRRTIEKNNETKKLKFFKNFDKINKHLTRLTQKCRGEVEETTPNIRNKIANIMRDHTDMK